MSKTGVENEKQISSEKLYAGDVYKGRDYLRKTKNPTVMTENKDLGLYALNHMKISQDRLMYSSGASGFSAHNLLTGKTKNIVISNSQNYNLQTFEVFHEGDFDYVVFPYGVNLNYFKINRKEALDPSKVVKVTRKKLCLPGTYLNGSRYVTKGQDDNLIISDTRSGRVLKYYISSSDGFKFSECK